MRATQFIKGVAEGSKEDMSKEVKAMATGTCPHCHGPVKKTEHPTLTQYHCPKCGIRASQDKQGVAEGAPIVVAQAPIHIRNPKKAPQPYRNQGDIVPDTKPPSTEKRGVKGRPGQRPMPKYDESTVADNYWDRLQREKALESAGVGIITKQNTTVDVNKNTPKKNLKAFKLI